jgi:TonB family protein
MAGNRMGILFSRGKRHPQKLAKVRIHILKPISEADNSAALDNILSKIFISPDDEALKLMVPVYWRPYLAGTDLKSRSAAWEVMLEENKISTVKPVGDPAGKPIPPHLVSSAEPKYNNEAASLQIEGTSHLGVVVDSTGAPAEIAILQPVGMGLDEQAAMAVRQWKFRPSTLNGNPVRVRVIVEVTFKCCPY